jgi:hypothetical protein
VELNAAMIYDVSALWGLEFFLKPKEEFYKKSAQTVKDINKAYDAAGLRRPIIGASIYEHISAGIEVLDMYIPSDVILAFEDEMNPANLVYYFNSNNIPKKRAFRFSRISNPTFLDIEGDDSKVDLNKIEARMWFYYCAVKYIDDGYKALHMGIFDVETVNDIGKVKTYALFNKIRDYAESKGTFVILSSDTKDEGFYNNTNISIPDFKISPLRPDEIQITGVNTLPTVLTANSDLSVLNYYPPAETPIGCYEYPRAPYSLWWDNYSGYSGTQLGSTNPDTYAGSWDVWGYDESRWFYEVNEISDESASDEIESFVSGIKTLESSLRGYVQIPGRRVVNPWEDNIGWYRLYDHPEVKETVKELWTPKINTSINMTYVCTDYIDDCDADHFKNQRKYTFSVPNPDYTTVYTWHIQNPDNSWQPFTYGSGRTFSPTVTGSYKITLRQDNLGFEPSTYGTITVTSNYNLTATFCCVYHDWDKLSQNDSSTESETTYTLYPNPAIDILFIQGLSASSTGIKIYSSIGLLMMYQTLQPDQKNEIDVSKLPAGIYFTQTEDGKMGKFVKQ